MFSILYSHMGGVMCRVTTPLEWGVLEVSWHAYKGNEHPLILEDMGRHTSSRSFVNLVENMIVKKLCI
jgi:hypothetical protein